MYGLHLLPVSVSVFSGSSRFLPQSKDMQLRLIGASNLPEGMNGCFSDHGSDTLAICPGCARPPAQRQLGLAPADGFYLI